VRAAVSGLAEPGDRACYRGRVTSARRVHIAIALSAVAALGCTRRTKDPGAGTEVDAGDATEDAAAPGVDAAAIAACQATDPRQVELALFYGPENLEGLLLDFFAETDQELSVLMYQLTVTSLVDSLIEQHQRGVDVRVMLDGDQSSNATARERLTEAGVEVRDAPAAFSYNHAKVVLRDREAAIVMSANMNGYSMSRERNYGIVDRDRQDLEQLRAIFDRDWSGTGELDLECTRLLVSPVNSRDRLLDHIRGASDSLDLAVMYITDDEVAGAIVERASSGVPVRALLADPDWIDSNVETAGELAAAGAEVRFLSEYGLHAKLVVADGVAFVGSQNLSYTSLDQNREVGVLVTDPAPAAEVQDRFEGDWALGEPAP